MPEAPNVNQTTKNTAVGTIIYTILNNNNRKVSYMFFPKLIEGNMEDSFNPMLTMDNKYPGTIKINKKNEIIPKIKTYLLSDTIPIGTSATRINRIKRIGNFLMFLKGYLNEFDIILLKFMKPPYNLLLHFYLLKFHQKSDDISLML